MWSGHGDQNSEYPLKKRRKKEEKIRAILTCDRRYDTFDLKKK